MDAPRCIDNKPSNAELEMLSGADGEANCYPQESASVDPCSIASTQSSLQEFSTTTERPSLPSPPTSTDEVSLPKPRKRKREESQSSSPREVVILELLEEEIARKPWKRRAIEEDRAGGKGHWPGRGRNSRTWYYPDRQPLADSRQRSEPFRDIYHGMEGMTPSRGTSLTSLTSQTRFPPQDQRTGSQSRSPSPSRRALYSLGRASPSVHVVSQDDSAWSQGALQLQEILLRRSSWNGVIPGKLRVGWSTVFCMGSMLIRLHNDRNGF